MSQVIPVNDQNFRSVVMQDPLPVLIDFTATWCGPCKQIAPLVAQVAAETAGRASIVMVDIDQAPRTAAALGVRSVPTLVVMHRGREVMRHVGGNVSKQRIYQMLGL